MICLIEALNFRCLRYIRQPLAPFHVLVGPNASGKTTFLDVVAFLGRLVSDGLEAAVSERTQNFQDLIWGRSGQSFELAIEAVIPKSLREKLANKNYDTIRYEIFLGIDPNTSEVSILAEKALLKEGRPSIHIQRTLFPTEIEPPATILTPRGSGTRTIINKVPGGNDNVS
jgi:predicted ATPase